MAVTKLLLLDGQIVEIVPCIQKLQQYSTGSRELQQFLQNATDIIQLHFATLNRNELQGLKPGDACDFETLLDLGHACIEQKSITPIASTVLTCTCLVGELILAAENDPSVLGLSEGKVQVLGLGIGQLPAAALAAARTTSELSKIGLEIISVAFRLALEVHRRSMRIEQTAGDWAYAIGKLSVNEIQEILDEFHDVQDTPLHKAIYIAVEGQHWTTISGPPSQLSRLLSWSPKLQTSLRWGQTAHSAVHASHLPLVDIGSIVGSSSIHQTLITSNIQVMSAVNCRPYQEKTLESLVRKFCHDICQEKSMISKALQSLATSVEAQSVLEILVLEPTDRTDEIRRSFEEQGLNIMLRGNPFPPISEESKLRGGSGDIAVVGMSGRFPGSDNVAQFWQSLLDGKEFYKRVPEGRFDFPAWAHSSGKQDSMPYGCFLEQPGLFDNQLFSISPREAAQMDPSQRLLLMISYEALQRAGYSHNGTLSSNGRRVATYVGQATDDWKELTNNNGIDIYYVPGLLRIFGPGRLNYHYKWEGAAYSVDSACASSMTAIGLACSALLNRDCDTALAGGTSILSSPAMFSGLGKGSFTSSTGSSKTFRADADGYCRAEGAGILVLKRLEDALLENDNILGVIKGRARNHSANATSITHPHAQTQERLYKQTLQRAGVAPEQISFVEMHGTGTQAGDLAEMTAVMNVFGRDRSETNPLIVGAVKANVGHAEAAAGVISMMKAIMILKTGQIPPQPGMPFKFNPKLPLLGRSDVRVADGKIHMPSKDVNGGTRKLVVNNFDASGGNECLVMEEAPRPRSKKQDPRSHHVVTVSAHTPYSLRENKQRLLEHLRSNPDTKLQDLSYTTTARAMHERLRISYAGGSIKDIMEQIRQDMSNPDIRKGRAAIPKVAFVFTGMSSQYAGMGSELFHTNARFRNSILSMQKLCDWEHLPSFVELISDPNFNMDTASTTQIQLGIVALELALADLWKSWGVEPAFVIGHSLGEYAALCVAGVLSIQDTLTLVGLRGLIMQSSLSIDKYTMLAVASSAESVSLLLKTFGSTKCQISCRNAPSATVVSGPVDEIMSFQQHLKSNGERCKLLNVRYGFHSAQFDSLVAEFTSRAKGMEFSPPKLPVASTLLGTVVRRGGVFTPEYLAEQVRGPVDFIGATKACMAEELADSQTVWLEVGPDGVCISFIKAIINAENTLPTVKRTESNWKTVTSSASAMYKCHVSLDWNEYQKEYTDCLKLLDLPSYAFDLENFWAKYRYDVPKALLAGQMVPAQEKKKLSLCLHHVEEECATTDNTTVRFVSNLSDHDLYTAINGHKIEGYALCPSSVFCDMAFTAASYMQSKQAIRNGGLVMDLRNLNMHHPIVIERPDTEQSIRVKAMKQLSEHKIDFSFSSGDGSSSQDNGDCQIVFGDLEDRKSDLDTSSFFIKARMDSVEDSVKAGNGHHLYKSVIYKLFADLVDYSIPFQAIDELFWNDATPEAVATITLKKSPGDGDSSHSPYWLDSIIHLAGFILNVNFTNSDDVAHICNGFESLLLVQPLSEGKKYRSYVRRYREEQKGLSYSDVYVFDQDQLVAKCSGLKFQRLPRKILHHLFGSSSGSKPTKKQINRALISTDLTEKTSVTERKTNISVRPVPSLQTKLQPLVDMKYESSTVVVDQVQNTADLLVAIVAEETGVKMSDIGQTTAFADMGVDSLLSISIINRVKEKAGIEIGANFFLENETVDAAKRSLGNLSQITQLSQVAQISQITQIPQLEIGEVSTSNLDDGGSNLVDLILAVVAEETRINLNEVESTAEFSDLGVDSLLSIAIIDRIHKDIGIEIGANFFLEHPTLAHVKKAFESPIGTLTPSSDVGHAPLSTSTSLSLPSGLTNSYTSDASSSSSLPGQDMDPIDVPEYTSRAVLINGDTSYNQTPLFMIADGAGSAAAYLHVPRFPTGTPIYALESPFLRCPELYSCSVEETARMYIATIRKHQPHGPYLIGGWSAGAVHAYEVARNLLASGETIRSLIILDMHIPKPLPDNQTVTMDLVQKIGIATGINRGRFSFGPEATERLNQHLLATVKSLVRYDAPPMDPSNRPHKTIVIWAEKSMYEVLNEEAVQGAAEIGLKEDVGGNVMEADLGLCAWFYSKRYSFGPNGWDKLVGPVECHHVDADHFSIVVPPAIGTVSGLIQRAIA